MSGDGELGSSMRAWYGGRGESKKLKFPLASWRSSCKCWTIFVKDGRRAGSRSQHARIMSPNLGSHLGFTMGIAGRKFSSESE